MLNIFAEALLIATRLGQSTDRAPSRREPRRSPREFMEIEGLHTADYLRNQGR
ncbi:MAG: hypothetical protein ACK47C_19490 [Paracoccaceae bacterium]|jgi:hypothetical protein